MALILTPQRLDQFSELYHQLGAMLASGITLIQALELIRNAPPAASFRPRLNRVLTELQNGATFSEALAAQRGWLPELDVALIAAGEQSGRLDACCQRLAAYYKDRARLARSVLADLAYPAFLLLLVLLIFPPGALANLVWKGEVAAYVMSKLQVLLIVALAQVLLLALSRTGQAPRFRAAWENLLHAIPVFGRARRSMALARLSLALEALLNAGVNALEAWPLAAATSGSPALEQATARARERMVAGETPGEAIAQEPVFPDRFTSLYRSGELSGRLDQSLAYLQADFADEAARLYKRLAEWTPRLVFLLVALLAAWFIVRFWLNYFGAAINRMDTGPFEP
jgi:type II secretory pathway component PulF